MAKIHLLSQATGYTVAFILSLVVLVPMLIHLDNFKGHCSLFTTGQFIEDDGRFEPAWASCFYCGWTVFVASASLIISVVQFFRMIMFLRDNCDSSFLAAFVDTLLTLIISIVVLITAVIDSIGFSIFCNSVTQRFQSCQTASSVMVIGKDSGIVATDFFIQLGTVQFGIWTLLVFWALLLVLAARKLFLYHERENVIVSMARERLRYQGMDNSVQENC